MGKNKRRGGHRGYGGKRHKSSSSSGRKGAWLKIVKENERFEKYYRGQKFIPEEEYDAFFNTLRKPLPSTFRISKYDGLYKHVRGKLEAGDFFGVDFKSMDFGEDYEDVTRPTPLPYYKENLGWYFKVGRKDFRKYPELKGFREWLFNVSEVGTVTRQESVSMLPPLLLDVKPEHWVLDMCAAPGSKTCQLIEFLHSQGATTLPPGVVIANDADRRRAHMLTKQIKRLRSPNFLVTCHEAQIFPNLYVEDKQVKFDRILADVPCSGDGTLRKNPQSWKTWSYTGGANMHLLQYRIAFRGAQLLKEGGKMVYSTCSFNPAENEAVVARLLHRCGGGLELLPASLPGLKSDPGMKHWKVMDPEGNWYSSYQDVKVHHQKRFSPFIFPPPEDLAQRLHLERCMRLMPHRQDTGGFFVAVLRRTQKAFPLRVPPYNVTSPGNKGGISEGLVKMQAEITTAEPQTTVLNDQKDEKDDGTKRNGQGSKRADGDEPFEPVEQQRVERLLEFYGMKGKFDPKWLCQRSENSKKLFFVAPSVVAIVQNPRNVRLRVVHCGLRAFERTESFPKDTKSRDRIAQDGVLSMFPFFGRQTVKASPRLLLDFFANTAIKFENMEPQFRNLVLKLDTGSCAILLDDPNNEVSEEVFVVAAWISRANVAVMCNSSDRAAMRFAILQAHPELRPPQLIQNSEKESEKKDNDRENEPASTCVI